MRLAMATSAPGCVTVVVGGVADLLLLLGALAIPATAVPLIMRTARRRPSRALLTAGRRARGIRLARWGVAVAALGLAGIVTAFVLGALYPQPCDQPASVLVILAIVLTVDGAVIAGGGWAYSVRANWVVLGEGRWQ